MRNDPDIQRARKLFNEFEKVFADRYQAGIEAEVMIGTRADPMYGSKARTQYLQYKDQTLLVRELSDPGGEVNTLSANMAPLDMQIRALRAIPTLGEKLKDKRRARLDAEHKRLEARREELAEALRNAQMYLASIEDTDDFDSI